jgi:ornithine cyclodeaminase/alanine dehydrogenase-like protein (mu-crystallin family)
MSLLLSDADVRQAMNYVDLADSIEAALKVQAEGTAVVPGRMNLDHLGTWLRVMPAIVPSANVMGLKVFHGVPGRGARYLILLYAVDDGSVLAAVDACYLTAARTAATSAVASRYLSPKGSVRLGVIGSGLEAETHSRALCAAGAVAEIKVFSPNEARRQAFAERMGRALGVRVTPCGRPEDAVDEVEHVVVATNTGPAMTVACRADWLSAGQHVTSIGSTNRRLRELDTAVFSRADLIVLDADPEQMAEESGDLIQYQAEGDTLDPARTSTLPDVIAGKGPGREHADQLTLYKSVGTALQDVIAADLVYRRARELGLGVDVTELSQEKQSAAHDKGATSGALQPR